MGEKSGRYLFEALPDLFPEGRLTWTECELWKLHYEERNRGDG